MINTFNADGSITSANISSPPIGGIDDTSIGDNNLSGSPISSIHLVQTSAGSAIFGLDGDGVMPGGVRGGRREASPHSTFL